MFLHPFFSRGNLKSALGYMVENSDAIPTNSYNQRVYMIENLPYTQMMLRKFNNLLIFRHIIAKNLYIPRETRIMKCCAFLSQKCIAKLSVCMSELPKINKTLTFEKHFKNKCRVLYNHQMKQGRRKTCYLKLYTEFYMYLV